MCFHCFHCFAVVIYPESTETLVVTLNLSTARIEMNSIIRLKHLHCDLDQATKHHSSTNDQWSTKNNHCTFICSASDRSVKNVWCCRMCRLSTQPSRFASRAVNALQCIFEDFETLGSLRLQKAEASQRMKSSGYRCHWSNLSHEKTPPTFHYIHWLIAFSWLMIIPV